MEDDSSLDAVCIGDLITLTAKQLSVSGGFLRGDGAGLNVGVQLPLGASLDKTNSDGMSGRDCLSFEDYVFRICPALTYRQRNELEAVSGRNNGGGGRALQRQQSVGQMEAAVAAMSMLESRVEFEEASNATVIDQVRRGVYTGTTMSSSEVKVPLVRYGDTVMLQHMRSGCFLTASEVAAPCDPECRATKLSQQDSAGGLFKMTPRFKAQTEGSIVYFNHTLKIESVKMKGMLLHTSPVTYTDIPNASDPLLPKCLQTGVSLEINLSPEFTAFSVGKYARFTAEDVGLLRTSDPFRLYHSQTESFMHASCDPEKDRRSPQGRTGGYPAHIPFLKKLPDLGDTPDPTDPNHHYPKGVWCFEPRNRRSASVVCWDTVYRVRHVPSGRYLAVDTTEPMHEETEGGMPESWYGTCLVDDASLPGEEVAIFDDAGDEIGFKAVPSSWLEFVAQSADVASGNKVPYSDVNLRLSHNFSGSTLYLHCNDERKPAKLVTSGGDNTVSVIARTLGLVFSTVKSAQDIFKTLPISEEERRHIETACSYRASLAIYVQSISNPRSVLKPELSVDTITLLLKLLELQVMGTFDFPSGLNWVTKANELLPVAFSCLFKGEPNDLVQRICRDVKIMDYVFAMGNAHYLRYAPKNPWTTGADSSLSSDMVGPQAVHKFAHVALQRMCIGNKESQDYFGNRWLVPINKTSKTKEVPWMNIILDSLDDPLGSAVTLSQLLNENHKLMHKYATPDLVLRFLEMIRNLGPQPRLVNFFEAICTVGGVAVKANQEMVLRLTWMNEEWRNKVYLDTVAFEPHECKPTINQLPEVREPSGELCAGWEPDSSTVATFPSDYIGKDNLERKGSFAQVFVKWQGHVNWSKEQEDLFWSPKAINVPTYSCKGGKKEWVRLEDLCWVMEPERLCQAVTGKTYAVILSEDVNNSLGKQQQLAQYYAGQLSMISRLCFGRSYNCIAWMERSFPYTTLCSMSFSVHLPSKIRAQATELIRCLYLDRFPQLRNFGRPILPEQLWVFDLDNKELEMNPTLPLIKNRSLLDDDALPGFALTDTHQFINDKNLFKSFKSHTKFFILRHLGNKYLESFGAGAIIHDTKSDNELANTIVNLISSMTSFGFQSTHGKIKDLLRGLVTILDGRSDISGVDTGMNFTFIPFSPTSNRFNVTPMSAEVTNLKANIINVLLDVANLRANFRLGKLLFKMKEYSKDKHLSMELKKCHAYVLHDQAEEYEGDMNNKLFNDFEELFDGGDGAALDLKQLSGGQEVDLILVDCLMYEDDKLFAKALELLERTYAQRRKLLNSLSDVVLLENESVPVFGSSADMASEISFLTYLVRSSEVWAVCSRVSGSFEADKLDIVLQTCGKLETFLSCSEKQSNGQETSNGQEMNTKFRQDILRSMGLQTSLIDALNIDYNISFKGSICKPEEKIKSRELLISAQRRLIHLVVEFVRGNTKNQNVIFEHLTALRNHRGELKLPTIYPNDFEPKHKEQMSTGPGMNTEAVILECLRNNASLCQDEVPRDLLEEFGILVDQSDDPSTCLYLEVFNIVCQPHGQLSKAIPRNQDMVLEVLLSDSLTQIPETIQSIYFGLGGKYSSKPERLIQLFSATICQGNLRTASKLQAHRVTVDATVTALARLSDTKTNSSLSKTPTPPGTSLRGGKSKSTLNRKNSGKNNMNSGMVHNMVEGGIDTPLFYAMLEFLSLQLDVLVVDPKMFRAEKTWQLLTVGVSGVLSAVVKAIFENDLSAVLATAGTACLKIAKSFISGALQLGMRELEGTFSNELMNNEDSLYHSSLNIAQLGVSKLRESLVSNNTHVTSSPLLDGLVFEMDELKNAAKKLCHVMDPGAVIEDEDADLDDLDEGGGVDTDAHSASVGQASHSQASNSKASTQASNSKASEVEMVEAYDKKRHHYFQKLKKDTKSASCQNICLYFTQALAMNPKLNRKLKARQFSSVTLLEEVEDSTGEAGAGLEVPGADGAGSARITWPGLVQRMVSYLKVHNHDRDESNCLRVLRVLRAHLVKARSEPDGTALNMWTLSDSRRLAYIEKQTSYVEYGVASACLKAIATHASNIEANLADEGVEMLLEMTMGGNPAVQSNLAHYILHLDRDNKLAWHIKGRLSHTLNCIRDRKERCEVTFTNISPVLRREYKNGMQTFNMLQQLCEGHNLQVQNVLREQPTHTASVDLMSSAANILITMCDTSRALLMVEEADVHLIIHCLDFLTEALQGPCPKNQELLVSLDGVISAVDKVLQSIFDPRIKIEIQLKCKSAASLFLAALLEGRVDMTVHRLLAEDLGPQLFEILRHNVMRVLEKSSLLLKKNKNRALNLLNDHYSKQLTQHTLLKTISLEMMSSISTILNELRKIDEFAKKQDERPRKKGEKTDLLEDEVRVLEIYWRNRVEITSFSIPQDSPYLSEKTKESFLKEADLSTSEKRMKQLLASAPVFMAEMEQIYAMSNKYWLYDFINHNIVNIKWSMYALVVLLNLNIVMASYGEGSKDGYVSIADAVLKGNVENKYINSLLISIVLATLNLAGYVVIVSFLAITEIPIIVQELDDRVAECLESITMKEEEYRDVGAFTWWIVTLIFNIIFIIQHQANYPDNLNYGLYSFLVFGINMPWTLACLRNYIVVPNTRVTRAFCVAYDVLVSKPFFRNHVLLMICSINGFGESYYFPLMLMDIMNNSNVIANIARSVTDNAVELGWVFYLFVITIIIYAQFGLEFFEEWFTYDGDADDGAQQGCHSVVSCFILIFYHGAPAGALDDVFNPISNRDQPQYLQRVMFDLSFFVWVGVLLFNIITGLMVDGFGALREEDNERKDTMENTCFVCGFTREAYDDLPNMQSSPSFDWHMSVEHQFWIYVDFYVYLKRKNKADLTGAESFAWLMIQEGNLCWIPSRNSAALQEFEDEKEVEEDNNDADILLSKSIAKEVAFEVKSTIESSNQALNKGASSSSGGSNKPWEGGANSMPLNVFLSWGGLERFTSSFISKGYSDPASFGDLSGLDDDVLTGDIGLSTAEIRRLQALVELRDVNGTSGARMRSTTSGRERKSTYVR